MNPDPGESAMLAGAGLAVRRLATRCLENPRFEDDPVAVLTNERDRMLDELEPRADTWTEKTKGRNARGRD